MKLLPYCLLNLATVMVALAVYDGLRSDHAPPTSLLGSGGFDALELEQRLAVLERSRQPMLRAEGIPPALERRIDDLDARLKALAGAATQAPAAADEPEPAPAPMASLPGPGTDPGSEPTPLAVAAFRRLQEAVRQEDRRARERQRVDTLLAKNAISLSAEQRESVAAVYAAFEERRNQVWTEAKTRASTAGAPVDWTSIVRDTNTRLERELGERLARVLPSGEAETVARVLSPATRR